MPRTVELTVVPAPSGRWVPPPPPLTVVEDDLPEAWAEFQRLQKAPTMNVQQRLLGDIGGVIQRHIEPMFKPGVKLTVIARTPGNDEADVLVSNDSLGDLAALIERSKAREDIVPVVPR